jgi:hypothetical protein
MLTSVRQVRHLMGLDFLVALTQLLNHLLFRRGQF